MQGFLLTLNQLNSLLESLFKHLINIFPSRCRCRKIFITSLFRKRYRLWRVDLFIFNITLIPQQYDNRLLHIKSIIFHRVFPLTDVIEWLSIFKIKDQKDDLCICEKIVSYLLVVRATAQVEKVYCYFLACNVYFLYTVIYADCGDILLDKSPFAVTLYYAWFSCLLVSNWD